MLRQHYSPEQVAQFNQGIDELQAIPIDFDTYRSLGVASHALAGAMENREHDFWKGANSHDVDGAMLPPDQSTLREPVRRVDMGICGTALWDPIVTDPVLNAIHRELAGGPCFISATYYIEKQGPASGGGLHNGGFPKDKNIYYDYDHRSSTFACSSTKSVTILSDMSQLAGGPFAAIPGSVRNFWVLFLRLCSSSLPKPWMHPQTVQHKSNFRCPFDMGDATKNPMAVPVYASPVSSHVDGQQQDVNPSYLARDYSRLCSCVHLHMVAGQGDVILFTEGMTHNAYPVLAYSGPDVPAPADD